MPRGSAYRHQRVSLDSAVKGRDNGEALAADGHKMLVADGAIP
jgi:hypothetical protein